jgi:hypothetical protein
MFSQTQPLELGWVGEYIAKPGPFQLDRVGECSAKPNPLELGWVGEYIARLALIEPRHWRVRVLLNKMLKVLKTNFYIRRVFNLNLTM